MELKEQLHEMRLDYLKDLDDELKDIDNDRRELNELRDYRIRMQQILKAYCDKNWIKVGDEYCRLYNEYDRAKTLWVDFKIDNKKWIIFF